jgi:LacI family transcriptional regulator
MTPTLAFVCPNIHGPFAAELQDRLHRLARGLILRLASDDPAKQRQTLQELLRRDSPRAMICVSIRPDADTLSRFRALNIPVVLIDEQADRTASVSCDNFEGGCLAGRHLLECGHTRVALITGPTNRPGSANADQRRDGFRSVLSESHVNLLSIDRYEFSHYSKEEGQAWAMNNRSPDVSAVFCAAGDSAALGILDAERKLAVIGFDDAPSSDLRGLTTIRQPLAEMAEAAYRMAVVEPSETLSNPRKIVFPPTLIVRRSTAYETGITRALG